MFIQIVNLGSKSKVLKIPTLNQLSAVECQNNKNCQHKED